MIETVHLFTDGACRGNPGPGGWGALLRCGAHEKKLYGAVAHTTNNRMELQAIICALQALKRPCFIEVTTDSQYVRQGITTWIHAWKQRDWRGSNQKPIKNRDLWEMLDTLVQQHPKITWHWVKGHAGHAENTIADQLANQAIDEWLGKI